MLPTVVLHNAVSVDGRMDWIQPDLGQFYSLTSRWPEDATLVGADTILTAYEREGSPDATDSDTPPDPSRPLLVVTDSRGRARCWRWLLAQGYWRAGVALIARSTSAEYLTYLDSVGVPWIMAGSDRVDLREALAKLADRFAVRHVRADCGGALNGALLRAGLVNTVSVLIQPTLVGGSSPKALFRAEDLTSADQAMSLRLSHVERLQGDIVWLVYEVGGSSEKTV